MNISRVEEMILALLSCPTAPFHEDAVATFIERVVEQLDLKVQHDPFGNLIVKRPGAGKSRNKLAFMAHMDHPGFEAVDVEGTTVIARWHGGVKPEYFTGMGVRFHADGNEYPGTISMIRRNDDDTRVKGVAVECPEPPPVNALGMWDLPGVSLEDNILHAIAVDDLAGCGVLVATLMELNDKEIDTEIWFLFTRAEETGFIGALGMAKSGVLPPSLPVISVEMSKALPDVAEQGRGPVVRVGDHTTIFNNSLIMFMRKQAEGLTNGGFQYQSALMDGGSCEATVMNAFGYRPAGLAVPLANYHNQVPHREGEPYRLDREAINFTDFRHAVMLSATLCENFEGVDAAEADLRRMLLERGEENMAKLRQSRNT